MSKAGMLGLLEGVGRGITHAGDLMGKNALAQAEDERRANLERVRREWAKEDKLEERDYQKTVKADDQLYAQKEAQIAEAKAAGIRNEDKADKWDALKFASDDKKADQQTSFNNSMKVAQFGVDNREPSSEDKKQERLDGMLKRGEITQEEYKNHVLGLSKSAGFTQKDLAGAWEGAYKQAAKEKEGDMKFSGLPSEEQKKILDNRAGELVQRFVGSPAKGADKGLLESPGVDLHPKMIDKLAVRLAEVTSDQMPAAMAELEGQGYSDKQIAQINSRAIAIQARKEAVTTEQGQNATAGPPVDPNWQQNIQGQSPLSNMIDRGKAMTPEEKKAAKEKREGKLKGSFSGERPY